jgi:hypothetical protein
MKRALEECQIYGFFERDLHIKERPYNIGEIWCATLMEMNRNIGTTLAVQLAVDALKLSPANPSFLDIRDSILAAIAR